MGRPIVLGNSRLTVGLNEQGLVHDFYYPYVGQENLTTARSMHHRIGVWVDGVFSWTDSADWQITLRSSDEQLEGYVSMINKELKVELHTIDFVGYTHDFLGRKIFIKNTDDYKREIRLFMHQVFEISQNGRGDTAFYVPEEEYIMDYKGTTCLLISGKNTSKDTYFDQFAVGNYGIEGKSGTYMDSEDGELSGHNIEHGGVDSVIRFSENVEANDEYAVNYWIIAADSQQDCEDINDILKYDFDDQLRLTQKQWQEWLSRSSQKLESISEHQRSLVKKSMMTIKVHTDIRGGVIASCDSSIYNYGRDYYSYVWPRDGAYAMWPFIRMGHYEEPKAYFNFCADIAHHNGYMLHKYQPDRSIGSTWHPLVHNNRRELAIQEDETAIVITMIGEFYYYSKDETYTKDIFERFIIKAADFLSDFIDSETGLPHASYDLWEERFMTTSYTTACVYRALMTAVDLGQTFGHQQESIDKWKSVAENLLSKNMIFVQPDSGGLRKGFLLDKDTQELNFDETIDVSSFYGFLVFGYFSDEQHQILKTAASVIEERLLNQSPSGGSPRYENDNYFRITDQKPNPWPVTSLWLAQYYLRFGQIDKAKEIIGWVENLSIDKSVISEQVHPVTAKPLSVTPLVWSHAEYINTVLDLASKQK